MHRDKEPARKFPQLLYSSNFDIVPIIFFITQALPVKYDCHRMLQFQNDYDKVRQNKVRQNFIANTITRIHMYHACNRWSTLGKLHFLHAHGCR